MGLTCFQTETRRVKLKNINEDMRVKFYEARGITIIFKILSDYDKKINLNLVYVLKMKIIRVTVLQYHIKKEGYTRESLIASTATGKA